MPAAELKARMAEAVERERTERSAAFLDVPRRLCGQKVDVLRVRHLAALEAIGSPFLVGGPARMDDVVRLVCLLSPDWPRLGRWRRRWRARRIWRAKFSSALAVFDEVQEYLDEALADAPGSGGGQRSAPHYSLAAALVGMLAREYHWSEREILELPLARVWQYRAEILERNGAPLFNRSDALLQEWLESNQPGLQKQEN